MVQHPFHVRTVKVFPAPPIINVLQDFCASKFGMILNEGIKQFPLISDTVGFHLTGFFQVVILRGQPQIFRNRKLRRNRCDVHTVTASPLSVRRWVRASYSCW